MKVKTWLDYSDEIEVEVSIDDFLSALADAHKETSRDMLMVVNKCASTIGKIPDDAISQFTDDQNRIIRDFLLRQADRFAPQLNKRDE